MYRQSESGRGLLEILLVFAVVGILTIIGISMYRSSMGIYNANVIYEDIMVQAESVTHRGVATGKSFFDSGFGNMTRTELPMITQKEDDKNDKTFSITVQGVGENSCERLAERFREDSQQFPTSVKQAVSHITINGQTYGPSQVKCVVNDAFDLSVVFFNNVGIRALNDNMEGDTPECVNDTCPSECQVCNPNTQRCEWQCVQQNFLESAGTQWIDTDYRGNTTKSLIKISLSPSDITGSQAIFGNRNQTNMSGTDNMVLFIINNRFRLDWASATGSTSTETALTPNTTYNMVMTRGIAQINGVDYTYTNKTSINQNHNFYIGTLNNNGNPYATGFKGRIFAAQIFDNDSLVRDFVPMLAPKGYDGYSYQRPCLYDRVSKRLFCNQGTEEFLSG